MYAAVSQTPYEVRELAVEMSCAVECCSFLRAVHAQLLLDVISADPTCLSPVSLHTCSFWPILAVRFGFQAPKSHHTTPCVIPHDILPSRHPSLTTSFPHDIPRQVVGGSCRTVAAGGGFAVGGGHGYLSPSHGLGVDNVLQYTLVLANGTATTASPCSNPGEVGCVCMSRGHNLCMHHPP